MIVVYKLMEHLKCKPFKEVEFYFKNLEIGHMMNGYQVFKNKIF